MKAEEGSISFCVQLPCGISLDTMTQLLAGDKAPVSCVERSGPIPLVPVVAMDLNMFASPFEVAPTSLSIVDPLKRRPLLGHVSCSHKPRSLDGSAGKEGIALAHTKILFHSYIAVSTHFLFHIMELVWVRGLRQEDLCCQNHLGTTPSSILAPSNPLRINWNYCCRHGEEQPLAWCTYFDKLANGFPLQPPSIPNIKWADYLLSAILPSKHIPERGYITVQLLRKKPERMNSGKEPKRIKHSRNQYLKRIQPLHQK
eukprot:Gb_38028 [translate_table: standard]